MAQANDQFANGQGSVSITWDDVTGLITDVSYINPTSQQAYVEVTLASGQDFTFALPANTSIQRSIPLSNSPSMRLASSVRFGWPYTGSGSR